MDQYRNSKAVKLAAGHYWQRMKHDWRVVLPGLILPAIGTVFVFYIPAIYVGKILTWYGQSGSSLGSDVWQYVGLLAGSWLLGEGIWRIGIYFLIKADAYGIRRLYLDAMDYLLAKDLAFFNDHFAGSLTKKTIGYAKNYETFVDTLAFNVFSNFLPLIFICFILWRFSPWLALTLIFMTAFTIGVIVPLIRRRQRLVAARETAANVLSGNVADTIGNMPAVRAFANEPYEAKKHKVIVEDFIDKAKASWHYQNMRIDIVLSPLYVATNVAGLVVALIAGKSGFNAEAVFITFTYYSSFTRVMWEFNRVYRNIESAITDAAQFTELLLDDPKITDPIHPDEFKFKKGHIEFRDVQFSYQDSEGEHLFNGFNLDIKPGEKVGLVGHSGGGKTTVTRLLMRFMDISQGQILIDGQDISKVRQADFRAHLAYVPQDPIMFHRSLAENISYGKINATPETIEKASRVAHAHEFIEKLPKRYETLVGERGVKLSGGQRQRVAIARAMVKDAPILVLDEATSALDSESEKLIQDALWKLMQGRTAIVIAHRLSTIQKMDRIIVLEDGKVAEEGTHKDLLSNNGIYATLWAHQSGGFLEE